MEKFNTMYTQFQVTVYKQVSDKMELVIKYTGNTDSNLRCILCENKHLLNNPFTAVLIQSSSQKISLRRSTLLERDDIFLFLHAVE